MAKAKTWLGEADRYARRRKIESLDFETDWLQIAGLSSADFRSIVFPVPFAGFMTTFAAPRMSRILYGTGEITDRFAKRAVDTILFAKALHEHGFGTPEGRKAAQRVNQLHSQYDIHQDDFIAVGCDPYIFTMDLFDAYGWRPLLPVEREAHRRYYDRQARAFGSRKALPASEAEMRAFVDHYFDTQLRFEPQNRVMAETALDWFVGLAPPAARGLMRRMLLSTLDPRVVAACGLRPVSRIDRTMGHLGLKLLSRRDPAADDAPDMLGALVAQVYPDGYRIETLGPSLCGHAAGGALQ